MFNKRCSWIVAGLVVASLASAPVHATVVPDRSSPVAQKEFRHANLRIPNALERADLRAGGKAYAQAAGSLGVSPQHAFLDVRGGRWGTLLLVQPLIPGTGANNSLSWDGLGIAPPTSDAAWADAAREAFVAYLGRNTGQLAIDVRELADPRVTVHDKGDLIQIHVPRVFGGLRVRDSYLTAVVNHGNLVLFGAYNWGTLSLSTRTRVPEAQAVQALANHLAPVAAAGYRAKARLEVLPLSAGALESLAGVGRGYDYRLVWVLSPRFEGEIGTWEAMVDAHSGELLSFQDLNHYQTARRVLGGVYPVSNDGVPPDGVEVPGTPMPFVNVVSGANTYTTDTGGNVGSCLAGSISTTLSGPFLRMTDVCGAINETSAGDLDLSQSAGTDCVVPAGHSPGDTHATRTGYYELNKLIEQAKGQLPGNVWLTQQLTANMNILQTCNAFYNGSVNFFQEGGQCNNTGELAGIFDHEWGHGMDDHDANPGIANPGEGVADIYGALRLNSSCMGRNFFKAGQCGGYGDPCVTGCDGVRDIDWANHASGLPHDLTWIQNQCPGGGGVCGGEVHCEGYPTAEVVWDYFNRDLPGVFGMSSDTALEIATRTMYLGGGPVGNWYQCVNGSGGCPATSGYMNFLAVDDDNGNLLDGTPHMQALFDSFNRHGMACTTPTVQNSGCPGGPTAAPVVSATPIDRGVNLSWAAVAGAIKYKVLRTEGVFACDFGKAVIGETFGTTFSDLGLQNGRTYSYGVMAIGLSGTCMSPMSACTNAIPVAGANLSVDIAAAVQSITSGDADPFLDNCENASVAFSIANNGNASQTNVRIALVQPLSHPAMPILTTSSPTPSLASCGTAPHSFTYRAVDMVPDDVVSFRIDVTSDQLFPAVRSGVVSFAGTEGNNQFIATQTADFETSADNWTVAQGTFNRTTANGGGAGGAGTFYFQSSANLDNQCDEIHSPVLTLTPTSTLSLANRFGIEPFSAGTWYDRANVARENVLTGARTVVAPSGGRLYNVNTGGGPCGMSNDVGWADTMDSWAPSTWTSAALGLPAAAGQPLRINVKYGTDGGLALFGFRFDQVTLTNFNLKVADGQSDTCAGGNQAPVAVPDSDTAGTLGPVIVSVLANDSDPNADCLRVTAVTTPPDGTAFINFVGCNADTVTYVPDGTCGNPCNDTFNYTVSDGQGGSASATVTIDQTPVQLQGLSVE